MVKKVFVLGLPGSGKSTAARYIEKLAQRNNWSPIRFNDYDILYEWFQADEDGRIFSATEYGGFDVHDHNVFDEALEEVERRVVEREKVSCEKNQLIIIEFARDDYYRALRLFSPLFLRNASFLFVDADIPTCIQRIKERVAHRRTPDDHYVSSYIFEAYYQKDNRQYLASTATTLKTCCEIDEESMHVVDNTGSNAEQKFLEKIEPFVTSILEAPVPDSEPVPVMASSDGEEAH
jgi:adenylate kinase family enzyme